MGFKLNQHKLTLILITAVLLVGLMILAGTLSQIELSQGETFNLLPLLKGGNDLAEPAAVTGESGGVMFLILTVLFWVGLAASIICAFISPQYRRRALVFLLMAVLLFYGADHIVLEQAEKQIEETSADTISFDGMETSSPPLPQPPAFVTDPPHWISWVVSGVVALLLVGSGFYIWHQRRQPDPQSLFVQEAEQALQELDAGGDLKDVVLRCYAQMEGVMRQSQELERKQSMTPREFGNRLAAAGFSDEHIGRLIRLFEEVRYGGQLSNGRAEREARDCLSAIAASYS